MLKVLFIKRHIDAIQPVKAHKKDCCYDLFSLQNCVIPAMDNFVVDTGIGIQLPEGFEGQVRSRSGMAINKIFVLNGPGTIDEEYIGNIKVILMNLSIEPYLIKKGAKIAQLKISKVYDFEWIEVDYLGETERGQKGFGSTGR